MAGQILAGQTAAGEAELPEIVLSARCDRSPFACEALDAVFLDLARTPRRRGVRWDDRADGAETGRGAPLAHLEIVEARDRAASGRRPRVRFARSGGEFTPGWLVHAVLRAGEVSGVRWKVEGSVYQQLARRSVSWPPTAADRSLGVGVPAVVLQVPLTDGEASAKVPAAISATVRRLDALGGQPRSEDRYLVVGGRVWVPRDLLWLGLGLWMVWLIRELRRGRRDRSPGARWGPTRLGFLARGVFLAALLVGPEFVAPLAVPAVLLRVVGNGTLRLPRPAWVAASAIPWLLLLGSILLLLLDGARFDPSMGLLWGGLASWAAAAEWLHGRRDSPEVSSTRRS